MVDRYYLAKAAITAIVADESFVDPNPDGATPSPQEAMIHALALVDSLMTAFGIAKERKVDE